MTSLPVLHPLSATERSEVSIILPVYNESALLEKNVKAIEVAIHQTTSSYEIIIVEDGSTDDSSAIASTISQRNHRITHIHSDTRLGKGGAIKKAFGTCAGDIVVFMDIDLATNLKYLKDSIKLIREGHDAAIGSRAKSGSKVKRPLLRKIASHGYNILVNTFFNDGIFDHQCGFKAFSRQSVKPVVDEVIDSDFFFDTEFLIRIHRRGLSIVEFPIEWTEPRASYLHEDPLTLFVKLIRLRLQFMEERFRTQVIFHSLA